MLDGLLHFIRQGGHGSEIGFIVRVVVVAGVGLYCLYIAAVVIFWVVALSIGLFQVAHNGVRAFRGRNRAVSVPRHAVRLLGRGAVVTGREAAGVAVVLAAYATRDADLTRELGRWPAIYRRPDGFVLKARHLCPAWVHFAEKASGWTAIGCFIVGLFGSSVDFNGFVIGGVAGLGGGALSYPVWRFMSYSRLVIAIGPGWMSWRGWLSHKGEVRGQEGAEWRIEANAQHPSGPEEQRLHSEAIRTGIIKPDAPYKPAYHNASLLVVQSGYRHRDWQTVAEIAGDHRGRESYRLQTAIQRLHEQCEAEAANTVRQTRPSVNRLR